MSNRGDFWAGMALGGIVGALLGLLLAPAPGEETRRRIGERVAGAAETARERLGEVGAQLRERVRQRFRAGEEAAPAEDAAS